jgi:hypothetical protein
LGDARRREKLPDAEKDDKQKNDDDDDFFHWNNTNMRILLMQRIACVKRCHAVYAMIRTKAIRIIRTHSHIGIALIGI